MKMRHIQLIRISWIRILIIQ